ncbi:DNA-binding HxlR family transcriptional regulator [Bradyrhizobium sp. i1.7.7]
MVRRTSFEGDSCPIARSLEAIGDWWSLLIIREALFGLRRFGEFQSKLGMAKNILAVRLRALVDHGILATAPASDGSAYQEYVLTPKGRGTFPILVALRQWSEEFDDHPEQIATILLDREKGRPVKKLEMRAEDGRLLSPADTMVKPRPGAATAVSLIAARCHHTVIASAARQSRVSPRRDSGLLRCARNDDVDAARLHISPSR